jgi:hypothetical protein
MIAAHIGGVPVEEMFAGLAGPGVALLVARAWLVVHVHRHREPGR